MEEEPEDKESVEDMYRARSNESKNKGGFIKNMKLDFEETTDKNIEDIFPKDKISNEDFILNSLPLDIFELDTPQQLKVMWAEREAENIVDDLRGDFALNIESAYNTPDKKGSMYIPSYGEDFDDEYKGRGLNNSGMSAAISTKVPQADEYKNTYKIATGTRSELTRELNALKKGLKDLEKLKPLLGPATYNNVQFEVGKNILPRIKFLESSLNLNVSIDYVNSEISEMGNQINKKSDLTDDFTTQEINKKMDKTIRRNNEMLKNNDEYIKRLKEENEVLKNIQEENKVLKTIQEDNLEYEHKVYEIDGQHFYCDKQGNIFRIDFDKEREN